MDINATHHYPVPPARLLAAFAEPEFWVAKYTALGARNIEVLECGERDGALCIKTCRDVPLKVPSFAKKVLSPSNRVLQHERWAPIADDRRGGSWEVEVDGRPILLAGTMLLSAEGGGCRHQIDGSVEVKIRLIGGTVARFLAGDAARNVAAEHEFTKRYLAERAG